MMDKQTAMMAEVEGVVAAKPVIAAAFAVDNDTLIGETEDDDWKLESAVRLDDVRRVGLKRKLREL